MLMPFPYYSDFSLCLKLTATATILTVTVVCKGALGMPMTGVVASTSVGLPVVLGWENEFSVPPLIPSECHEGFCWLYYCAESATNTACWCFSVCFMISDYDLVLFIPREGLTIWVCTTTCLWSIPMAGIHVSWGLVYGPYWNALSSCPSHCFRLLVPYPLLKQVPIAIQWVWLA